MSTTKAPVRLERFQDLEFVPRFEYGEMAEVAGICGADDGTELGTELIYEAKSALIHFAIHPANWSAKA